MKKSWLLLLLVLLGSYVFLEFAAMGKHGVAPTDVAAFLKQNPDTLIVDVREPPVDGKFTDSYSLPLSRLPQRYGELPDDRPVLLHCEHGNAVKKAYFFLRRNRSDIRRLYFIAGTPVFETKGTPAGQKTEITH